MAVMTVTRYECDWCNGKIELGHPTPNGSVVVPQRPQDWTRAQIDGASFDLCPYCAEALRALAASRTASAHESRSSGYASG